MSERMKVATVQADEVEPRYLAAKERRDALVSERARRWIEDPELYFAPDERDYELIGQIYTAHQEFLKIQERYLSARGEYYFIGCVAGEHKYCRREIRRDGALLVCGCSCHKTKEV